MYHRRYLKSYSMYIEIIDIYIYFSYCSLDASISGERRI